MKESFITSIPAWSFLLSGTWNLGWFGSELSTLKQKKNENAPAYSGEQSSLLQMPWQSKTLYLAISICRENTQAFCSEESHWHALHFTNNDEKLMKSV
jgi:hypothetical protein